MSARGSGKPKGLHRSLLNPKSPNPETSQSWVDVAESFGLRTTQPSRDALPNCVIGVNIVANFILALEVVFSSECLVGCALAIAYTLLYYYYGMYLAINMSWNLVSLAVIFPISQGIGMGFKRREQALGEFGNMLGHVRSLWGAVHCWKASVNGSYVRVLDTYEDPEAAQRSIGELFERLFAGLIAYFDVERTGRARQATNIHGREEARLLQETMRKRSHYVGNCFARLQRLVQDLKTHGLPGGEAHRLDQYISKAGVAFDRLTMLKEYRTPQAFRAFARIYILIIGAMYGPYYMYLSRAADGSQDNLGLSISFACAIQIAMSGLFNVMLGLEDPFDRRAKMFTRQLDSVHVAQMMEAMRLQLLQIQDDSEVPWDSGAMEGPWGL